MAAAEKFKTPENPAGIGGDLPSTISQPIQEESEGEVSYHAMSEFCTWKVIQINTGILKLNKC